jgi:hypothetical protein
MISYSATFQMSMDIHVYPMNIGQDCIYMGYTWYISWYIPCIYWKSGFQMHNGHVNNSLGILYIIFYSFDRIFLEKVFSTVFTRIFYRKYFLEKIPVNFYSGFISIPLDCFCARSYLRSLKSLIFGGRRRRNIRAATIMHLPKRIFYRKLVLQDFSRENSRYRNFL